MKNAACCFRVNDQFQLGRKYEKMTDRALVFVLEGDRRSSVGIVGCGEMSEAAHIDRGMGPSINRFITQIVGGHNRMGKFLGYDHCFPRI